MGYGQACQHCGTTRGDFKTCCERCSGQLLRAARRTYRLAHDCASCGKVFTPKRSEAKFCSAGCKQRAYRQRALPIAEGKICPLNSRNARQELAALLQRQFGPEMLFGQLKCLARLRGHSKTWPSRTYFVLTGHYPKAKWRYSIPVLNPCTATIAAVDAAKPELSW
jgi:hypothetical protein